VGDNSGEQQCLPHTLPRPPTPIKNTHPPRDLKFMDYYFLVSIKREKNFFGWLICGKLCQINTYRRKSEE